MSDDREPWSTRRIGCVTFGALGLGLLMMIVQSDPTAQPALPSPSSTFTDDLNNMKDSDGAEVQSSDTAMSFEGCLETIQRTASEVGATPVNIVETSTMRMVRFPLDQGSVLITCGDDKMVVTRSPHGG